ncbi:MAG: hydroxymethylbilane synthase [Thermosulfidibacteraceae bacterium]|jgi:hydroxymethylbilane synthase
MKIRIGTRGSKLALWQANYVKSIIEDKLGWEVELVVIKTKGDVLLDVPLAKIGGKGLFVKEIEEAMLRGEVDIAVHSLKDVPSILPSGLEIIAYTDREDPYDVLLSMTYKSIWDLPEGAIIGTSSLRRRAQIKRLRKDLKVEVLRGNLDTRIRKLKEGKYDAIIVAYAGLKRLDLVGEVTYIEVLDNFIPACGQGVLAIEAREGTFPEVKEILDSKTSRIVVEAERSFLRRIGGSCQIPVGAIAYVSDGTLSIRGFISHIDGDPFYDDVETGRKEDATILGEKLADRLLRIGGERVIRELIG